MVDEQVNPFEYGPYIQVAAFCERVLKEGDGVISLIRIVDIINHIERGTNPPADMPEIHYPLTLVLTLKAGRSRGRHEVTITPELPSGETLPPQSYTVQLEGEGRGTNLTGPVNIAYRLEGLYWFIIKFDGQFLTRLPLQVRYTRVATG